MPSTPASNHESSTQTSPSSAIAPVNSSVPAQNGTTKSRGGRNLMILGIGAMIFTLVTTGVSLWIYRSTGDIYLDRSRPGFLPDEEEADKNTQANTSFTYSDTGPLDRDELDNYLDELQTINERLRALADPYAPSPLSDESLGIKPAESPEDKDNKTNAPKSNTANRR